MVPHARPTLQAIVDQALFVTSASTGRLLAVDGDGLRIVATAGPVAAGRSVGTRTDAVGARGYVLSSGQPAALMPRPDDRANDGAGGRSGVPKSLLAVPCGDDRALGVLEVADKAGASPFSFDDIEQLALLASVAGAALSEDGVAANDVSSPAALAAELDRLAVSDPRRYSETARLIEALLGQGG